MTRYLILGMLLAFLLAACSTPTPAAPAAPAADQPAEPGPGGLEGPTLLQERCTDCHSLARVERKKADYDKWLVIVRDMDRRGAMLNDEEEAFLVDYLAKTYHK